jgi:UPF0755 protein
MKKIFLQGLVLLLVALFGFRNAMQQVLQTPLQFETEYFEIKSGTNLSQLCRQWQQQQQMSALDCQLMKIQSLVQPQLRQLKAGVYAVQSMRLAQFLQIARTGKVAQFSLTLREGFTVAQNLQALKALPYLDVDVTDLTAAEALWSWPQEWGPMPLSPEALLFPDTYFYTAHTKLSVLLKRAHQVLLDKVDAAWQQRQTNLPLKNRYELLTLASIIEKETGHLAEKPLIASVFVNRLNTKMRLQTDPTVIYGLGARYQGDIKREHLRDPHPYNTYVHAGLPPGPITLVTWGSLQAAAQPVSSDKLYFVAKGDGTHQFSASLAEHNRAVQQYIFGKKL